MLRPLVLTKEITEPIALLLRVRLLELLMVTASLVTPFVMLLRALVPEIRKLFQALIMKTVPRSLSDFTNLRKMLGIGHERPLR